MAVSHTIDNKRTKAPENFDVQGQLKKQQQEISTGIITHNLKFSFNNLYPLSSENVFTFLNISIKIYSNCKKNIV